MRSVAQRSQRDASRASVRCATLRGADAPLSESDFRQVQFHPVRGPRCHSAPQEAGVFGSPANNSPGAAVSISFKPARANAGFTRCRVSNKLLRKILKGSRDRHGAPPNWQNSPRRVLSYEPFRRRASTAGEINQKTPPEKLSHSHFALPHKHLTLQPPQPALHSGS